VSRPTRLNSSPSMFVARLQNLFNLVFKILRQRIIYISAIHAGRTKDRSRHFQIIVEIVFSYTSNVLSAPDISEVSFCWS
jgi:hypothetical protein